MFSHMGPATFMLGFVLSTLTYYLCLMTYKYVGQAVPFETEDLDNNYEVSMIMYAVFGGLGWCILSIWIFSKKKGRILRDRFATFMLIVWGLLIGLVFVPPHNKWRKYKNYKDAIGTGVATLDCWKNGTTLKLPDPSTGINYVELAGNWSPEFFTAGKYRTLYGFQYHANKIVFNGPLRCQFEEEIFAVCIEKVGVPCYPGNPFGFTMLRRASVMPYTDGWLLNKVPGYKENKLSYWEWDVNPREFAIEYVDLVEDEEVEFWFIAASAHVGLTLLILIVNMCLEWCSSRPKKSNFRVDEHSIAYVAMVEGQPPLKGVIYL